MLQDATIVLSVIVGIASLIFFLWAVYNVVTLGVPDLGAVTMPLALGGCIYTLVVAIGDDYSKGAIRASYITVIVFNFLVLLNWVLGVFYVRNTEMKNAGDDLEKMAKLSKQLRFFYIMTFVWILFICAFIFLCVAVMDELD